jgi:hypothetical protein
MDANKFATRVYHYTPTPKGSKREGRQQKSVAGANSDFNVADGAV